jgi:crotonobetainyl-CoA:carnitine CoA-transferase CaiB-like acyl-CoA transferase
MREWGQTKLAGRSLWWPIAARNKKSITLNLRTPEGQEIIKQLVKDADVLLENFRPGTMEKWGLGYDVLSEINPKLIMVRVSGYGQTGPYSYKAGYASVGEAMGGLRYVMGYPDRAPSRAGISIGDTLAATYACLGTMMALHHRDKTGRGQVVDSAIYEAVFAMMESLITEYQVSGYIRERTGAILPKVAPSNIYNTSDGMVIIGANQDTVFGRLAKAVGHAEWSEDPRYSNHNSRGENQEELDNKISEWTTQRTSKEVLAIMDENGVPSGKLFRAPEMLEDPHFKAREAIVGVPYPEVGELKMQNAIPKLSETPGSVRWAGPELGEHNQEVYGDLLGFSDEKIKELKDSGNI